jgi:hypothetical protein
MKNLRFCQNFLRIRHYPSSTTLSSLTLASVLSHSPNTVFAVRTFGAHPNSAFGGTSQTPETLVKIFKRTGAFATITINKKII